MSLFNKFKETATRGVQNFNDIPIDKSKFKNPDYLSPEDKELLKDLEMDEFQRNDGFNLMQPQKPESFHHYILENQYQDVERLIRGFKDVWNKEKERWETKRKEKHCFTDEEAEDILRVLQGYFSTDIKLATLTPEEYPIILNMIFDQLWVLFREIMEYRFGRFGDFHEQLKMKQQAISIFNVVMVRIKANLSRSVGGKENKYTHESVQGQESLNYSDRKQIRY
jgi:hypothetical protein